MLIFQYMTPESSRFGMKRTDQEFVDETREQKRKQKRGTDAQDVDRALEERMRPRMDGPQIFSREQFGKASDKWIGKLNTAQEALMKEINRRAYKGESVDALEAQAALLKSWNDRLWSLSLENAHLGLTDPDGVVSMDQELLNAVEGDPVASVEAALERAAYPAQLEESARGLESVVAERKARENREKQMSREIAGMRETMDTLEDRMRVIQEMRKDIDEHEDKLIESGEFAAEKLTTIDIEREEMQKLHARFFDEITKVMRNFDKLLEHYEEVRSDNPFAKAA